MDKASHWSIVERQIADSVDSVMPHGGGTTISEERLRAILKRIAQVAFGQGEIYALLSLMTAQDVADVLGISPRRVRARARVLHERFAIGWQVPGTNAWLFRPEEIESLRPGPSGRPKKNTSTPVANNEDKNSFGSRPIK